MRSPRSGWLILTPVLLACLLVVASGGSVRAGVAIRQTNAASAVAASRPLAEALPPAQWRQLESAVDRALAWLSAQQKPDGSFPTADSGQPAITSLCVLAFLSRGHQPGAGPYHQQISRAIDFVIACQMPDGLFSYEPPGPQHQDTRPSHTAVYNHAISGLMLAEVYGHVSGQRAKAVRQAIEKALQFTRQLQVRPKEHAVDKGGWRYLRLRFDHTAADSDLSVTAWQIMFLRSARNAEFTVPQNYIDDGMAFVRRCWDARSGVFYYALVGADNKSSRGMVAAGIVSLELGGQHQTPMALAAGNWLLAHPYRRFGEMLGSNDNFFYSTYYCSQAALQLGGRYWERIFPPLVDALLSAQATDGSWPPEPHGRIAIFGNAYTTAMAALSLTPPYQLLPVYQR